jgi:hypothetical protein
VNAANLELAAIGFTFSHLGTRIIVDEQGTSTLPKIAVQIIGPALTIGWPAVYASFILEETDHLSAGAQWSPTNLKTTVSNGRETATLPVNSAMKFYRLRRMP